MHTPSRREFLDRGLKGIALFAFPYARVLGSNDRIRIGMIGVGNQGTELLRRLSALQNAQNITVTAVCDVWRVNREAAAASVEAAFGQLPYTTSRYTDLLARADVDAVVIATPDFSHAPILLDAISAGKDVYCEKPLTRSIEQAVAILNAVRASAAVVQVGTQLRSDPRYALAREIYQSGQLGIVSRIVRARNMNSPHWARPYDDVQPQDVDWEQFLIGLPRRPFDPRLLRQWHLFRELSHGIPGIFLPHDTDLISFITGETYPSAAVSSGGIYVWHDGRQTPDTFHTLLEYPSGFLVSWSMGFGSSAGNEFAFYATNGTLDLLNARLTPEGSASTSQPVPEQNLVSDSSRDLLEIHLENWLQALRTRATPSAPVEAGFYHTVASVMAAEAYWTQSRQLTPTSVTELS